MGNRQYPKGLRLLVICLYLSASWLVLSPAHTAQAQSSNPTHIVQPGETLSSIAARYGTTYLRLARYNGIVNPNLIRSGQRLRIPLLTSAPAVVSSPPVDRPAPSEQPPTVVRSLPACHGELSYTVRRGDSLSGISVYYNVTVNALKARNNLPSSLILVGQRLIIPSTC
jgi:LysM repeat protein